MNEAYRSLLEQIRFEAEHSSDPETRARLRHALEEFHHFRRDYIAACKAGESCIL